MLVSRPLLCATPIEPDRTFLISKTHLQKDEEWWNSISQNIYCTVHCNKCATFRKRNLSHPLAMLQFQQHHLEANGQLQAQSHLYHKSNWLQMYNDVIQIVKKSSIFFLLKLGDLPRLLAIFYIW